MPFCVPDQRERCGKVTGAGTGLEREQEKRSKNRSACMGRLDNSRYHAGKFRLGKFPVFMYCYGQVQVKKEVKRYGNLGKIFETGQY